MVGKRPMATLPLCRLSVEEALTGLVLCNCTSRTLVVCELEGHPWPRLEQMIRKVFGGCGDITRIVRRNDGSA